MELSSYVIVTVAIAVAVAILVLYLSLQLLSVCVFLSSPNPCCKASTISRKKNDITLFMLQQQPSINKDLLLLLLMAGVVGCAAHHSILDYVFNGWLVGQTLILIVQNLSRAIAIATAIGIATAPATGGATSAKATIAIAVAAATGLQQQWFNGKDSETKHNK